MTDPLRDRSPGEPYPTSAKTLNPMLAAARAHQRRGIKQKPGQIPLADREIRLVNKSTTETYERFSVVAVGAALNDSERYKANHVFQIDDADPDSPNQTLAILQAQARPNGGSVPAIVSGLTPARVTGTPAPEMYLAPNSGDPKTLNGVGGPTRIRLLDLPAGESIGKVFIEQHPFSEFWAEITSRTSDGSNKWLYSFKAVDNVAITGEAINTVELNNDGTNEEGNGWWMQTGDELLPIGIGCIVFIRLRSNGDYWFQQANLVKPKSCCPSGSSSAPPGSGSTPAGSGSTPPGSGSGGSGSGPEFGGVCCVYGVCYDNINQQHCANVGGTWYPDLTCDDSPCDIVE